MLLAYILQLAIGLMYYDIYPVGHPTNETVLPKIVGVAWPRPRPLSGKIICAPARHSQYKAAYKIWSL